MRRWYRQFARKTYRYLRNPKRRRENRLHGWLGARVLSRDLWRPERHAVGVGAAIGLAVAMLPPIPVQMVLAATIAVVLRANIPIAAAACWVSNPVTWAPIFYWQNRIGDSLLKPVPYEEIHPGVHGLRCTALGAVVMAVVLAPLGYFVVFALWDAVAWCARKFMAPVVTVALPRQKLSAKKPPLVTTPKP